MMNFMPQGKKLKEKLPYILLEVFLIFFSVFLAFSVSQWQEKAKDRQRGREALNSIIDEIEKNRDEVKDVVDIHKRLLERLNTVQDSVIQGKSVFEVFYYCLEGKDPRIPLVQNSAWETAKSSGANRLIEYKKLTALSELYNIQEKGLERASDKFYNTIFDSELYSPEGFDEHFYSMILLMQTLYGNEYSYIMRCDEVLAELSN